MDTSLVVPSGLSSWELMATLSIAQSEGIVLAKCVGEGREATATFMRAGGLATTAVDVGHPTLDYAAAYRQVDQEQAPYVSVLAHVNGYMRTIKPTFPNIRRLPERGIVLAPFGIKPELDMPKQVWFAVENLLRTYGVPVLLVGDHGQRLEPSAFTESEILSNLGMVEKLEAVASAQLVVGVPNAWTWAAASFDRKLIYAYPETLPAKRWFHYISDSFGRILFHPNQIRLPLLLASIRELIKRF